MLDKTLTVWWCTPLIPAIALLQTRGAPFCSPLRLEQSFFKTYMTQPLTAHQPCP